MNKIFLDMDGTVCESKQKISKKMKLLLSKYDPIIISGASRRQMEYQLDGLKCTIMAQSGNDTPLWKNALKVKEVIEINKHIQEIWSIKPDMIDNRGCQISLSLIGHHAPIEQKKEFDPNGEKRKKILKDWPFKSKTLTCKVAGTTCFDYTRKDGTKGKNISRWIKENKLNKKDCVYYGDALFKGGNDESVIGVIKTVAVKNPNHLMELL